MPSAESFRLLVPPQIAAGEVTRVTAVLVGGAELASPLTISLLGDVVSASGGSVPITIAPGQLAGSAAFTVLGNPGPRAISVVSSGGNPGMTGPTAAIVGVVGPDHVPPSGLRLTTLDVPAGSLPEWSPTWGAVGDGPSGKGQIVLVELIGNSLPGIVTLTPTDGDGGEFLPRHITWGPRPDRFETVVYYFPRAAGPHQVTFVASGLAGSLANSSILIDANP